MWVLDQKGTSIYEVDSVHAIDSTVFGNCNGKMVVLGEYEDNKRARAAIKLMVYMLQSEGANKINYLYQMVREDNQGNLTL